jgi:mannan endo-1,4-beta-mannosidase
MRLSKLLALVPLLPLALAAPSPAGHPDSAPGKANSHAGDLAKRAPAGFVTPSGTGFSVDGRPFCFAGMNAYWMAQFVTEAQVSAAFARMQEIGVKVLRTWAFSMVESVPGYDLTYYQVSRRWNGLGSG